MGEQESGRESQGQEGAAHTSSRGCPAGVRAAHRLGLTFCSLLANTAASEHLLLRFSSSHGLQASLWNSRDCPHSLFLIGVYSSLQKAQRNLLHTAAKYNKTQASEEEFSQLVPHDWSPISPSTFLLILFIITQAVWSSQSYQFPQIHFQITILKGAWAPDQAVSAWHSPRRYWRLPWNAGVQLARPEQGLPRPSPSRDQEKRKYWSAPFNMLICPVAAQSLPGWTLQKETVFKAAMSFSAAEKLKLKTNEFKPQIHRSTCRYSSAPQTEMFDVWKDRLVN